MISSVYEAVLDGARAAGHDLWPGLSTIWRPVGERRWFNPNTGLFIVNIDTTDGLPYLVTGNTGDVARVATYGKAKTVAGLVFDRYPITFTHERGIEVPGWLYGPGCGPMGHQYRSVHVPPDVMVGFGLDRENRHRKLGMDRQVLVSKITVQTVNVHTISRGNNSVANV